MNTLLARVPYQEIVDDQHAVAKRVAEMRAKGVLGPTEPVAYDWSPTRECIVRRGEPTPPAKKPIRNRRDLMAKRGHDIGARDAACKRCGLTYADWVVRARAGDRSGCA